MNVLSSISLVLLTLAASLQSTDSARLPNTAAGKRVEAYISAFNSGSEETMREFFANNVSAKSLEQRPIDARLEVYRRMKNNLGTIKLRRVLETRDDAITVLVETPKGDWFELGFQFEPQPPSKLAGLRIEDAEPPASVDKIEELPAVMTEAQVIEAVEKQLLEAVGADEFSGVVLIAREQHPVFEKAYGLASKEYNAPNRLDTKFNLGSINKVFTQIAVGQLIQRGRLSLDDSIVKHLPDYPNGDAARKVTVRQLLAMTSGIGDFFGPEFESTPKDRLRSIKDFLTLFAHKPLLFEPGTKRQYSNGGYVVLGAIIERVSGQDYFQYVRENIFKPADMRDTDWYESDIVTGNLASGYTREGSSSGTRRNNIYTRPARGSSAGGGYSTVRDLLKFGTALEQGKLQIPDFGQGGGATNKTQKTFAGLGVAGGAPGINAVLDIDDGRGYTIVVMSNYDPPSAEKIARRIRNLTGRIR
ncbi:MAG TPA: serine hydrolase domain-containing protein [Blastocatellia bacterium]|nr:serine hydrolase domain-containing protein [Blastocatellia bacterium]